MNERTTNALTALKAGQGKYGANDIRGAHAIWQGRLWDVLGVRYRDDVACSGLYVELRTFNRERTASAIASAVELLDR